MLAPQLIVNGLIAGSIYALIALGFSLIYSTNKILHFAHGISIIISAYSAYTFFTILGVPFWISAIITLIIASLFGFLTNRLIYNPLKKRKSAGLILLIASAAVLILFENLLLIFFGASVKSLGLIEINKGITIFGAIITPLQITIFGIAIVSLALAFLLMYKTKLGRNMRALSDNKELTNIIGINSQRISDYSFLMGSALAGLAGILVALEQHIQVTSGTTLMIKGFTSSIIGGIGSVPGAIIGSFILGLAENLGVWVLPSEYKDAIAFVLLFIFLLFMPNGLLGINKGVKK